LNLGGRIIFGLVVPALLSSSLVAEAQDPARGQGLDGLFEFRPVVIVGQVATATGRVNSQILKQAMADRLKGVGARVATDDDPDLPQLILYVEILERPPNLIYQVETIVRQKSSYPRNPDVVVVADGWRRTNFDSTDPIQVAGTVQSVISAQLDQLVNDWVFVNSKYLGTVTQNQDAQRITKVCEASFDAQKGDGLGFVGAVYANLKGSTPPTPAALRAALTKTALHDSAEAKTKAANGSLVVANYQDDWAIVVAAPAADNSRFPTAYWGKKGGIGKKNMHLSALFSCGDFDNVKYYEVSLP
jgi:hypothetical protein